MTRVPGSVSPPDFTLLEPWLIDIVPWLNASQVNWNTNTLVGASALYVVVAESTGAQNAEATWDTVPSPGTWTYEHIHETAPSNGIYTVQLPSGTTIGTIDGYSAGTVLNVRSSFAGAALSGWDRKVLRLLMATKNASSSSYAGRLQHLRLMRTA